MITCFGSGPALGGVIFRNLSLYEREHGTHADIGDCFKFCSSVMFLNRCLKAEASAIERKQHRTVFSGRSTYMSHSNEQSSSQSSTSIALRRIMAGLKTDYRFYLCTMTFLDYCENVVAPMIEFGKPLGEANFNYLRETYPDHSIHYFWFNRWADVMAFQKQFEGNMGPRFDNAVAEQSFRTMGTA
jgi:hypothetical protein